MTKKKIIRNIFLFALLFLLILPSAAFAGIHIVPAIIRVDLSSGKNYNTTIQLQNTSRENTEHLIIHLEGSERDAKGQWKYSKIAGGEMSMLPWTKIGPTALSLPPGEKGTITLQLDIPKQAKGDFRVALIVEQDQSKMLSDEPEEDLDTMDIELGKRLDRKKAEEITANMVQYVRVAIPVYVRALQASALAKMDVVPRVKLGKLKISRAEEGQGTLRASLLIKNTGRFDLKATGACKILHGAKKTTLKIVDLSGKGMTILPKSERMVDFIFSAPLPVGNYIASAGLKFKTRKFDNVVNKGARAPFKIDKAMAASLAKLASGGVTGTNVPYVPLLVDPVRISLSPKGIRIKPLKLTITNPTNQTLNVRSIFRSASQSKKNKPSAKIIPDRFSIEPGKSERIRVEIKPADKDPVYGRLLFAVKGMGGSRPAEVPIMIVPKGVKLNPLGSIANLEVLSVKDGKSVRISGKLKNTGNAHLDDISAEILIKDFLDNPVKKNRASVSRKILFPAEKTRLFSDFSLSDLKDDIYKAVFVVKSKGAKTISESFRFKVDSESDEVVRLVD